MQIVTKTVKEKLKTVKIVNMYIRIIPFKNTSRNYIKI